MKPLLALAALLSLLQLTGCQEDYAWHHEITLVIATPEGEVTASAVQAVEVEYYPKGLFASPTAFTNSLSGEAVVADLGGGRYLFALLPDPMFVQSAKGGLPTDRPDVFQAIEALRGQPPFPARHKAYPRLVTFTDVTDPSTVALVDPDDLAATFGEGYALEAITVAVTDAPVTKGVVEGVLGWLGEIWPNRLDGQRYGNAASPLPIANSMSANSFSTEVSK